MVKIPITFTIGERTYAGLPEMVLKNRFFERNPTLTPDTGAAMVARPGTSAIKTYGDGPIRATYSLPGLHNGALFFVSGETLYRRETNGATYAISGVVYGSGRVSMTGVAGADYERLFIADGTVLQYYAGGTHASGTLTATGQPVEDDVVRIGDTYYRFKPIVSDGDGTAASPFDVLIGPGAELTMQNLAAAINFTGTSGTTYSSNLGGQNTQVTAESEPTADTGGAVTMDVTARSDLNDGNSIVTEYTTSNTVPTLSWGAATLTGGGTHALTGVSVPDGLPPIALGTLKSYVLVAIANSGRFFWVEPGAVTIEALNFATAESQPDDVLDLTVVGDTAMFVGEGSTEVWYPSGDANAPFLPVSGRVYDRGCVEGTVVNVKGMVLLVGPDHIVYAIGGSAERVSNHAIEQIISEALEA